MRKNFIILLVILLGLPLLTGILLINYANTSAGRSFIMVSAATLTGGRLNISGLDGHLPEQLRSERIICQDEQGAATIEGLQLRWRPWRLLHGEADISQVQIARFSYIPSVTAPPKKTSDPFTLSLPLAIQVHDLQIAQLDLPIAPQQTTSVAIHAQAHLDKQAHGNLQIALTHLSSPSSFALEGQFDGDGIHAQLSVQESSQGLLAILAGWQDSKPMILNAQINGPLTELQTQADFQWEQLKASLTGTFNAKSQQADWQIAANAPAMQAHAGLAWQKVAIHGSLQGAISQPSLDSQINVQGLRVGNNQIGQLDLTALGDKGQMQVNGKLYTVSLANGPDLLQASPVILQTVIHWDQASHPVTLALQHPLFNISGNADTAIQPKAQLQIELPNLQAFTALKSGTLAGKSSITVLATQQGNSTEITLDGSVGITDGQAKIRKLLGNQAAFGLTLVVTGMDMVLSRCQLRGKAIALEAKGSLVKQLADFNWQLDMTDISMLAEATTGKLTAIGQIKGPLDDFSTLADVTGEIGTRHFPRKPVIAKLTIAHLPHQPLGQATANAVLAGAPLEVAIAVTPQPNQTVQIKVNRADWKSLRTQGTLAFGPATVWPSGNVDISIKQLADFSSLLKQPLSGALTASLKTSQPAVGKIVIDGQNIRLADTHEIAHSQLSINFQDALTAPRLNGQLQLEGMAISGLTGTSQIGFNGTPAQLAIQATSHINDLNGAPLDITGKALYSTAIQELEVSTLTALWQKQNLHLLAPVEIRFSDAITVKNLQLAWDAMRLQANGQLSPTLDINAKLQQLDLNALKSFVPSLPASGKVSAEADLRGTLTQPIGTVTLNADNLRLTGDNAQALAPARLHATAELDGGYATLQAKLNTNDIVNIVNMELSGTAPLTATGLFDLRGKGLLELKLFDVYLAANGRRVRGQIAVDGRVSGTLSEPQILGTLSLKKVELRDYAQGVNITAINGVITAKGSELVIDKLQGEAGDGTIGVTGSVVLQKTGLPVNLGITARNAKPLASDQLAVVINADLTLRGLAAEQLLLLGAIQINRADIRIPERLPPNLAVLKLKTPDNQPPPPATTNSPIALNLVVSALDEVFVRGRGIDAELGGSVKVRGTVNKPDIDGGFKLRRGAYTLGGKTLTFSQGQVSFDSAHPTDPSLNFVVNNTKNSVTTTLTIAGTASKPKITLSSVPELPRDEVLAYLLFGNSASNLSLFETLQIGSAVAALTGASSGLGDPLDYARKTLGLDRLSIGGKNTSLEAGRYVVPGVYLGTRQGLSGGPQATIQIDITKHIKLEAAVGATTSSNTTKNANPNSLGIIYEFDY